MERTGVVEIDLLLETWVGSDPMFEELMDEDADWDYEPWYGPLSEMRDPTISVGFCTQVALELAEFLAGHGLDARSSEEMDSAVPGHPFSGAAAHTPAVFGLEQSRESGFPFHAATIIAHDGTWFSIDLTAAQYGDTAEWPLVQRWDGERWQRTW